MGAKSKDSTTTTDSLRFRLCGLNVFFPEQKKIIFKDKYWGRYLTQSNLTNSLALFFFDGVSIRKDVIA